MFPIITRLALCLSARRCASVCGSSASLFCSPRRYYRPGERVCLQSLLGVLDSAMFSFSNEEHCRQFCQYALTVVYRVLFAVSLFNCCMRIDEKTRRLNCRFECPQARHPNLPALCSEVVCKLPLWKRIESDNSIGQSNLIQFLTSPDALF